MYDTSIPFTPEQITLIESNGLTIGQLGDFWARFPDQDIDTAIGGCKQEIAAKAAGLTPGLESSIQQSPPATGTDPLAEVAPTEKQPPAIPSVE